MASQSDIEEVKEGLFKDVCFFLADESNSKIKDLLKKGGASREFYISDLATHVIADTKDFGSYEEARETTGLPIVTCNWVLLSAKCGVLLPLNPFYLVEDQIFNNVVACPSQISAEDRDAVWAMITFYGGKCQTNLNQTCTHLIISKPQGSKYECALQHQDTVQIVTPDWVVDSIKAKECLDEKPYLPVAEKTEGMSNSLLTPDDNGETSSVVLAGSKTPPKAADTKEQTDSAFLSPISQKNGLIICDNKVDETPSEKKSSSVKIDTSKDNDSEKGDDNNNSLDISLRNKENGTEETHDDDATNDSMKNKEGEFSLSGCVFSFSDYQESIDSKSMQLWYKVIEGFGGKVEEEYCPAVTHLLCRHQQSQLYKRALDYDKCVATANWLNDILADKKMYPPSCPMHLPVPFKGSIPECKHMIISVTGYEGRERTMIRNMINTVGANYTPHLSRQNTHLVCKSTDSLKFTKAKEWNIPCINARWLSDIMAAGHVWPCRRKKYNNIGDTKELEISSPFTEKILGSWQKLKLPPRGISSSQKKKRTSEDSQEENGASAKVARTDEKESVHCVVWGTFTGMTPSMVSKCKNMLEELGGHCGTPKYCTHLIVPEAVRTAKFLTALSCCKKAVSVKWLFDSHAEGKFLDESDYSLVYKEEGESININETIKKAQQKKLLENVMVFVTPHVQPEPLLMKDIIECAGGQFLTSTPSQKKLSNLKSQDIPSLAVIACYEDLCMCTPFIKCGFDVYNTEFILSGILRQELEWEMYKL